MHETYDMMVVDKYQNIAQFCRREPKIRSKHNIFHIYGVNITLCYYKLPEHTSKKVTGQDRPISTDS